MSTTIIIILVVIVVLIIAFYVFAMIMRRQTENHILDLEERKENLFDLPVQDEIDKVKKMHLVGQSQTVFREWNQKWIDLSSNSFADLEEHIFQAEQLNDSFRFFQARESVADSEAQIKIMETEVEVIREGIAELIAQEKRNSNKIQESLDLYEALNNEITDNAADYGTVLPSIKQQLAHIETEFSQFVTLNSTGDPIEAAEILDTAEEHTLALRAITERIPYILNVIEKECPNRIEELQETVAQFKEEKYILPQSVNLEQKLETIQESLKEAKNLLEGFELEGTELKLETVNGEIDSIYNTFENEYKSRQNVEKRIAILKDYVGHARTNNKNLMLEIDHAMQFYILSDSEKSDVRTNQEQLDNLDTEIDEVIVLAKEKTLPYSAIGKKVDNIVGALEDIEENQVKVSKTLTSLKEDEKIAQETAERFESQLRIIKRYVEKFNLPGLPKDYLDLFFMTTERIEGLFRELGKVRINMDVINHLVDVSTEDMYVLKDATDNLVDHAILAEQLMQYSNRYKTTNDSVALSISRSMAAFDNNRDYNGAFEEISRGLDAMEPGAVERISGVYYSSKEKPEYR